MAKDNKDNNISDNVFIEVAPTPITIQFNDIRLSLGKGNEFLMDEVY